MLRGELAMLPWMTQQPSGGVMYAQHCVADDLSHALRPPPPLIDIRKFNQVASNTDCPATSVCCSVPTAVGSVPYMNCSVPHVSHQASSVTYRAPPMAMQQDYAGGYFMCGYRTSPSYQYQQVSNGAAYTRFDTGSAQTGQQFTTSYSARPHGNGVVRSTQEHRSSMRYAPYQAEKSTQSHIAVSQQYTSACGANAAMKNEYLQAWTPQRESTRRLAEKIWMKHLETQACLFELNSVGRTACIFTQQILKEELVQRCRTGCTDQSAWSRTSTPAHRRTPVPMTTRAPTSAGQDAYSRLYVNTSPPVPATTCMPPNVNKNVYSPTCEDISPPLSGCVDWSSISTQRVRGSRSRRYAPLAASFGQISRDTSSAASPRAQLPCGLTSSVRLSRDPSGEEVECLNTVNTTFFRKFPCSLFKKKPRYPPAGEQHSRGHVTTPTHVGGRIPRTTDEHREHVDSTDFRSSLTTQHRACADTPTNVNGSTLVTTEEREYVCPPGDCKISAPEQLGESCTVACQDDASLDTSVGSSDSDDDRLYIHIPQEEQSANCSCINVEVGSECL